MQPHVLYNIAKYGKGELMNVNSIEVIKSKKRFSFYHVFLIFIVVFLIGLTYFTVSSYNQASELCKSNGYDGFEYNYARCYKLVDTSAIVSDIGYFNGTWHLIVPYYSISR